MGKPIHGARILWSFNDKIAKYKFEWRPSNVSTEKPLVEGEEGEDKTETKIDTLGQRLRPLSQQEATLGKDLWSLCKQTLDVREEIEKSLEVLPSCKSALEQFAATIGKTNTQKSKLTLCQVFLSIVKFNRGEGPLACKPKLAEFSLSDLVSERIVPLVKYLDRKMMNNLVPTSSASSYVELVRRRTKAKATTIDGVTEQIGILTSECATMTIGRTIALQEREGQLQAKELKCKDLRRKLIAERSLCMHKEQECKALQIEVCIVRKEKEELRDGLEESWRMFEKEF
ncbi:hypothetical protein AXG93_3671s1220 [Marchantia polymorpha subsp. ruderalis]|uniref:Uncharacterized protein n=1 Tax=Marchantia polymorpha subsp. ruderalis TaxID=1480154 RepID=A0A176WIE0_MARPO|nr:hypothetical protein AXG93_3671s1220 [Marchantia polymorpha subsp. ruderalis]